MEVTSNSVIYAALFVHWFIPRIVPEHSLFVPLALHWICTSSCLIGRGQLLVKQGVTVEHFLLLPALYLLHLCQLFQALFLFSLLLELLILSHQLFRIVIRAIIVIFIPVLVTAALIITIIRLLVVLHRGAVNGRFWRLCPECTAFDPLWIL